MRDKSRGVTLHCYNRSAVVLNNKVGFFLLGGFLWYNGYFFYPGMNLTSLKHSYRSANWELIQTGTSTWVQNAVQRQRLRSWNSLKLQHKEALRTGPCVPVWRSVSLSDSVCWWSLGNCRMKLLNGQASSVFQYTNLCLDMVANMISPVA